MHGGPARVGVVGGGIVGLSVAWHLQEHEVDVTVLERDAVAAGASWGNAGWLSPAFAAPLPEPTVLRYAARTVLSKSSPVHVPLRPDPQLLAFLTGFARHSTHRRWAGAMSSLVPFNRAAEAAYEELAVAGVEVVARRSGPVLAVGANERDLRGLVRELDAVHACGQTIDFEHVTAQEARDVEPSLGARVGAALLVHGQSSLDAGQTCYALADSLAARGGAVLTGFDVVGVRDTGSGVQVTCRTGERLDFDAVVLASGAWIGALARPFGVRRRVRAGRGYSFSAGSPDEFRGPVYFPNQRVALTPTAKGFRIAGTMEFLPPDAPLRPHRIDAIVDSISPFLGPRALDDRRDEWVGSRPCTTDGLPLIGATASPRVFVNGGHGMWGVTHGPVSGRLLAGQIVTGVVPDQLKPFSPVRK